MQKLLNIMARLRHPENGCPWDLQQSFASIAPYTIEEAYEVADAIERKNFTDLRDELGDLLLQVVFHAQMADEAGYFNFRQVVESISEKMLRRHPHVFGEGQVDSAEAQSSAWEEAKAGERAARGAASLMDELPRNLPALLRAHKVQKRAAMAGFDWAEPQPVLDKLDEELQELRVALGAGARAEIEDELGDLMFATVNLARQLELDPGRALSRSTRKFERRFRAMEHTAGGPEAFAALSLAEQEALWLKVKQGEQAQEEHGDV